MVQNVHAQLHERRRATRANYKSSQTGGEIMKKIFLPLMAVVLTIHSSPSALAHSQTTTFSPSKNEVVTVLPKKVTIEFTEQPLTFKKKKINRISVQNPKKKVISVGRTKVVGNTLAVNLLFNDPIAGKYLVIYRMASQDGHVVSGSYRFTLTSS